MSPKPPREVVLATVGQSGSICFGFFAYALLQPSPSLLGRLLAWTIAGLLLFLLFRALLRGANWVRWLLLAVVVIGVLAWPSRASQFHEPWQRVVYMVQVIVQAGATALLFFPASNRWFSRAAQA
jgi:hypothetical protein